METWKQLEQLAVLNTNICLDNNLVFEEKHTMQKKIALFNIRLVICV